MRNRDGSYLTHNVRGPMLLSGSGWVRRDAPRDAQAQLWGSSLLLNGSMHGRAWERRNKKMPCGCMSLVGSGPTWLQLLHPNLSGELRNLQKAAVLVKAHRCPLSTTSKNTSLCDVSYCFYKNITHFVEFSFSKKPLNTQLFAFSHVLFSLWRKKQATRANIKKKHLIYFKNRKKCQIIRARLHGNHYRNQHPAPVKYLQITRWSLVK